MKKLFYTIALAGVITPAVVLAQPADSDIVKNINTGYAESKVIKPLKIQVQSKNGLVSLKGKVNNNNDYTEAIRIATNTKGVKYINVSELKRTQSSKPLDDLKKTAKIRSTLVKEKLISDKEIDHSDIEIKTLNDHVYLSGTVNSQEEKANIVRVANKFVKRDHIHDGNIKILENKKVEEQYV